MIETEKDQKQIDNEANINRDEYMQMVENNKYTFDLVNLWINNADTKISISCGISSVVFAVMLFWVEHYLKEMTFTGDGTAVGILFSDVFFWASLITFLASLWFHFLALNPKLTSLKKEQRKEPTYSIFFDDIRHFKNAEAFIECVNGVSIKDFNEEVLRETFINSGICAEKMRYFKRGMWLSVVAIGCAVLAGVIYTLSV